jgi:hypothetical protein
MSAVADVVVTVVAMMEGVLLIKDGDGIVLDSKQVGQCRDGLLRWPLDCLLRGLMMLSLGGGHRSADVASANLEGVPL